MSLLAEFGFEGKSIASDLERGIVLPKSQATETKPATVKREASGGGFFVNLFTNAGGVFRGTYGRGQQVAAWALVVGVPFGLVLLGLVLKRKK